MTHSENVTEADIAAFRGMPYRHQTTCKACGTVTHCAGKTRANMRCIEDFAKTRHRRIGQLRSAVRREIQAQAC